MAFVREGDIGKAALSKIEFETLKVFYLIDKLEVRHRFTVIWKGCFNPLNFFPCHSKMRCFTSKKLQGHYCYDHSRVRRGKNFIVQTQMTFLSIDGLLNVIPTIHTYFLICYVWIQSYMVNSNTDNILKVKVKQK